MSFLNETNKKNERRNRNTQLLDVKQLSISFQQFDRGLREGASTVVRRFDISIQKGEVVAVVGASGSGKSLLADAILGILPKSAQLKGTIHFEGLPLTKEKQSTLRGVDIALLPQFTSALDPLMKAGKQVQAIIKNKHKRTMQQRIFNKLGLTKEAGSRYPFELSGGMARRVLLSTAMAIEAKLLIADEPTSGLDEKARNESIAYIKEAAGNGQGVLFITHDIMTALKTASKIAVFYAGETVEIANVEDFHGSGSKLRHPYTRALWQALPQHSFTPFMGKQPFPDEIKKGCIYAPRCPVAMDICMKQQPNEAWVDNGMVRCFYAENK
ncbi:oligopeptide/dipeptide ABC transporter ATP-binding protein [Virgibacillus sp. W0430]|uniref:oligopeptide/dipeptide ABC transporter ATP-binding protein n=1 Tax=Virgibacillus sp. W0430 TaxID=3391580 RepID=UPI003F484174